MPKNKRGGKKHKKGKKGGNEHKRALEFREDGQEYAQVKKMLGNSRVELLCFDGKERLGIIRGSMRKRVWIAPGDIVLVGIRDYQDGKADILMKYTNDEARNLKNYGELPETAKIGEMTTNEKEEDCVFDFDAL